MDRSPATGVGVIPGGKAVTDTDFYDLSSGCVCRASWVPEVKRRFVAIFEFKNASSDSTRLELLCM